jgi:signal transduction histidine kinase
MSLTNRLSLFFLASLAVILAGFSLALYAIAATHLYRQADQRLEAAMQTLVASTEVFPDRIEWEPLLRRITLGEDDGVEQVRWTVHAADGRLVDCSRNLEVPRTKSVPALDARAWRLTAARVSAGTFQPQFLEDWATPRLGTFHEPFPAGIAPGTSPLQHDRTFTDKELVLTVAIAQEPIDATLRQLATWMGLLSLAVWLVAALGGRWMCRSALAPVIRMADSARAIRRGAGEGEFLDVAPTRDELQDLGIAFNELLADLRESLDRQQRFTADASHQLRTPLGAMLAAVEVALRQERSPAEYQRVLGAVRRRGRQLTQIIESLLFLARPDDASVLPEPECVDLADWCRTWLAGWQEQARAADIVLQPDAGAFFIRTHPSLLGQILDNLLDNACKYSEPGTPVLVRLAAADGCMTLTVTDRGCGIDEADRVRVFEPFFRSKTARSLGKPGTGLGLTVAHRLVRILGGSLEVISQTGQGSAFCIRLPLDVGARPLAQLGGTQEERRAERNETNAVEMENNPRVYKPHAESADSTRSDATPTASAIVSLENLQ